MLVKDEVRLRLFLDSIGFSDLSAKKIKKWMPEDRRQFEIIQERLEIPSYKLAEATSISLYMLF